MTKTAAQCPDLETIAAYLDGRLSARERTRVTAHLAECEECYALFRESAQTHLEERDRVVSMRTWFTRTLAGALFVVGAASGEALAQTTIHPPSGTGGGYVIAVVADGYVSSDEWQFDRAVDGLILNGLMQDQFYRDHGSAFTIKEIFKASPQSRQFFSDQAHHICSAVSAVSASPALIARYSSRWTVAGENAGRQTATYSAPSGPGVL